ncbi:MAG: deoxyribose-phosphate aldolase [Clostridia bacterium]|nr:deoxyribose-phosphate aldolase [Clostridia bacterium]
MDLKLLPRMIDLSCVKTNSSFEEMNKMVSLAKEYGFICCFSMPYYTKWLLEQLKDASDTIVGGAVGFPHGNELTELKVMSARMQKEMGCREIDMVQNVTALKNGDYHEVAADISAVKAAIGDTPLKVILEVSYLTEDEICRSAEIAVKSGASFVKTGTGWGPSPTTVRHIDLIRNTIGNSAKIKAAGGVRDLNTMLEMIDAGCTRFGIGVNSSESILREAGLLKE